LAALLGCDWEVAGESNRVGTRLRLVGATDTSGRFTDAPAGASGSVTGPAPFPSRATVRGAVQLPPDGCPVVLGPDHGTVGGYPVVAVMARSSVPASGQLRPGDLVRFEESHGAAFPSLKSVALRAVTGWMGGGLGG
jgi:allophanate hydrolase subunit 2